MQVVRAVKKREDPMRKSIALAISICAMLMTASGGTAQSGQLSIKNFDNRPQSLITPIIKGTHCQICCVKQDSTCTKWCDIDCGDIVVKNLSGMSVYMNKKTGKPVWLKGMRAPTAPSRQ
jgi:hypothetical protein